MTSHGPPILPRERTHSILMVPLENYPFVFLNFALALKKNALLKVVVASLTVFRIGKTITRWDLMIHKVSFTKYYSEVI